MPKYRVAMVRPEHMELWLQYRRGDALSDSDKQLVRVGWLDQVELIVAINATAAKLKATTKRPGWMIVGQVDEIT